MDLFYTTCFIVLLQFISVKSDEVAQLREQDCFSKAYQCTEHRVQFTASSSLQLETNPEKFAELCRRNMDFSDCIENAADFCSNHPGSMYDITNMFIENRRHIKTFCTNEEWQIKYFASATCINEYTDLVANDCAGGPKEKERNDKIFDPCKVHIPYISCKIKKIKLLCGITAGEVYRRLNIGLDGILGPWDVKCELHRRLVKNTLDQDNLFPLEDQPNIIRRISPLPQTVPESINENTKLIVIDKLIDSFSHLTPVEIDNLFHPEDMLRKFLFKRENKKIDSIFASNKISENESFLMPDIWSECLNLFSENVKRIILDSNIEGSKLIADIFENLLKDSCKSKKLAMKICFEKIKELIARAKHSKKVFDDLKVLNDFILGIFERLNSRELELSNPSESFTLVSTDIVKGFPLKSLNCTWSEEATRQTFHCTLKLNSSLYTTKEIEKVTSDISNVRERASEHRILNSEFTECGNPKYSNLKSFTHLQETEFETFKQENINFADKDASNDVHRIGYKIKESKKPEYPDLFNSELDPNKNEDIHFTQIAITEQSEQNEYKAELNTPDFIESKPLDSVKDGEVFSPKMKYLGHFEETKYNEKPYKPEFPKIKSVKDENEVFLMKMADLKQSGKTEYSELYKPDVIEPKYFDSIKDSEVLSLKMRDLEHLGETEYIELYKPDFEEIKSVKSKSEVFPVKLENSEHPEESEYYELDKPDFIESIYLDSVKDGELSLKIKDLEYLEETKHNELYKPEFAHVKSTDKEDGEFCSTKINLKNLKETEYNDYRYKPEFVEVTTDKYKFKKVSPIEMTDFEHPGEREYNELEELVGMIKSDVVNNEEVSIMEKSDIESSLEEYTFVTEDAPFTQTEQTNLENKKSGFNSKMPTSSEKLKANDLFKEIFEMLDEFVEKHKIDLDRKPTIEDEVKFLYHQLETYLRKVIFAMLYYPKDVSEAAKSNVGKLKSEKPSKQNGPERSHEPVQSNFNYRRPIDEL